MNIGMILDNEFTGDLRVENEVIALQNAGYKVYVLCLNYGNKETLENFYGATIIRKNIKKIIKNKLRGLNNTIFNFYPILWANYIKKFIKTYDIKVLHVHDLWMLEGAYKANKVYELPVIADLHENYVDALKGYKYTQKFPANLIISINRWREKEKEWTNKAYRIITVIEEAVQRYVSLGNANDKIIVLPNYVNLNSFLEKKFYSKILNKYEEHFTLTYVGGFDTHRGLESIVYAMPTLIPAIPNIKLVLVGNGSNYSDLKRAVSKLEIENFVDFEGWQSTKKIPTYIESSDITIIPHLKSVQTDNTIPHKLFQYMIMGKPVVATNCNPIKRIINETGSGVIYESSNSKEFAKAIIKLYNNAELRKKMGEKGRKAVKLKYNWDIVKEQLIKIYKNI